MTSSKVCLNMIVKNEAKVITRCLDSVKDFISCLAILDTGSSDDTYTIILEWCAKNNVPWRLGVGEFIDFASARNRALDLALTSVLDFTHLLFLDAGMEMTWPNGKEGVNGNLHFPQGFHYTLNQHYGNLTYANSRLVSRELPMKWVGVCHEYLECDQPAMLLHGPVIECHSDGGNQTGQMERYRDLLKQGLKDEPTNVRYMFYLAQTYFDLQEWSDAAHWYGRRISAKGWEEETWYAMFRMAEACANSGRFSYQEITAYFLSAYYYRPTRVEPLVYLARYLGVDAPIGIFPKPSDKLFVEEGLYA